jgi:hypothetical protein
MADVERRGGVSYNASDNSFNTPRGRVSANSFGSAGAMRSAGFSEAEIKDYMDSQAKSKDDVNKKAAEIMAKLGLDEGDYAGMGGGGGRSGGSGYDPGLRYNPSQARRPGTRPTVAGLSRSDGQGGQIGVQGDDLFGMIRRRYDAERQSGQFNENANGTPSGRP